MYQLLFLDSLEFEDLNDRTYIQTLGYDAGDFMVYYVDSVNGMHDRPIMNLMKHLKKQNNWF